MVDVFARRDDPGARPLRPLRRVRRWAQERRRGPAHGATIGESVALASGAPVTASALASVAVSVIVPDAVTAVQVVVPATASVDPNDTASVSVDAP